MPRGLARASLRRDRKGGYRGSPTPTIADSQAHIRGGGYVVYGGKRCYPRFRAIFRNAVLR